MPSRPMNKSLLAIVVLILLLALGAWWLWGGENTGKEVVKIGVITDLTGPGAYWGERTAQGVELALRELEKEGYVIDIITEESGLEASKAVSAAQKLVNIDGVDALYVDFNPAAISVGSFLAGKDVLFVYDAAVESPLASVPLAYKTYLDFRTGCRDVAREFKKVALRRWGS